MDMIERVAAAMAADHSSEGAFDCGDNKAGWTALATVAIEAMRDPSDEMTRAAHALIGRNAGPASQYDCKRAFQGMIDAALAPTISTTKHTQGDG